MEGIPQLCKFLTSQQINISCAFAELEHFGLQQYFIYDVNHFKYPISSCALHTSLMSQLVSAEAECQKESPRVQLVRYLWTSASVGIKTVFAVGCW